MRISDWSSDVCSSDLFSGEIRTTVVSVIVPVWNSATHLQACIDSLLRQTLARDEYEVILVDNGSLDESLAIAQSCKGVRLFVEKRPGSYAARNLGISAARGEYVAFMDSDCVADPGWLENGRSEEHTSTPVTNAHIVCRL